MADESKPTSVMLGEDTGWGYTSFHYTKEDVLQIFTMLDENKMRESRVFCAVWEHGCFKDRPRSEASFVVSLIERVKSLMLAYGRSFEQHIWEKLNL